MTSEILAHSFVRLYMSMTALFRHKLAADIECFLRVSTIIDAYAAVPSRRCLVAIQVLSRVIRNSPVANARTFST